MRWRTWFWNMLYVGVCAFLPCSGRTADFIEINAELETVGWSWRGEDDPPTASPLSTQVRCVVGTNSWMITTVIAGAAEESWWYTGSNIVRRFETATSGERRKLSHLSRDRAEYETTTMAFDGDVRGGIDRVLFSLPVKIAWLAFCSGTFLKKESREVPMPSELWKETWLWWEHASDAGGFKDQTLVFEDGLGLPKSVDVFTRNKQPLLEYRIRHGAGPGLATTNVLGWEVPLEFYLVQYMPAKATNTWQVYSSAKGKTTSVTVGKPLQSLTPRGPI